MWWRKFWLRLKCARLAWKNAPLYGNILKINDGVEINLITGKITFTRPTQFHCQENFVISSDKHVIIQSGQHQVPDKPGMTYGVWMNPETDFHNQPILMVQYRNTQTGEIVIRPQAYDNGRAITPEGFEPV